MIVKSLDINFHKNKM